MGFYILQRPSVPTPAGRPGGAGEEASSSFVSGQKWPPRPEPVPRQRPGKPADCTMPRLLPARALPRPACLSPPFLPLALCTPSSPCSPFSFHLAPPLSFNSPLSFFFFFISILRFLLSFPPSFLSLGLAPCFSCYVSGSVSLRLCPLMSSRSLPGPGPAEGYTSLLSAASSRPRAGQGPQPPGLGEVRTVLGIWRKPRFPPVFSLN